LDLFFNPWGLKITDSYIFFYNKAFALGGTEFSLNSLSEFNRIMTSYILLRSNKESGPHNLSELKSLGLKPNDLIWVEGQSVSWRNPGEIKELKTLLATVELKTAPPVYEPVLSEEKPMEQFNRYQPPPEEKIPEQSNYFNIGVIQEEVKIVPERVKEVLTHTPIEKRRVFVAMPANGVHAEKIVVPDPVSSPVKETNPVPRKVAVISDLDDEPVTQTKYSKPLDEIKEMYVRNMMQQRRKRTFHLKDIPNGVKQVAVVAGLIICGIIIGLMWRRSPGKESILSQQRVPQPKQEIAGSKTVSNESLKNTGFETGASEVNKTDQQVDPVTYDENYAVKQSRKKSEAKKNTGDGNTIPDREPVADDNAKTIQVRNEISEPREVPVENILSQVFVKSNNYKVAAFGGVKDLQLTVRNDSKYVLDNVTVELQYLKPSELPLKTETVYFKSVPPNGTQTIAMPKTNRGIKVIYKITKIESKAYNASLAGL
jgi:hypothetical protein